VVGYVLTLGNIKNQRDLKTTNRDCKKATKQGSRYCLVESVECVIHMTGNTYCSVGIYIIT